MHGADVLPDARPYLVTELCEGSLADRIAARGRLDPHEVTAVGLVVGRALLHAHDAGVRHGDLTPESVLLRDGAVPVLAGFELAVLCDYRDAGEPTPAHAAPETVRADGAVDERTDVYGLGSILFTALAGAAPFPTRRGEQEQDRLARILLDEPPAPPGPAWLAHLVRAMLAKDPAARPTLHRVVDVLAADARRCRPSRCQEKPLTPTRRCPPRTGRGTARVTVGAHRGLPRGARRGRRRCAPGLAGRRLIPARSASGAGAGTASGLGAAQTRVSRTRRQAAVAGRRPQPGAQRLLRQRAPDGLFRRPGP